MATSRPLLSLVASLNPFSTTIPRSPLREYWGTERASGPVDLQSCNRITCLMTSSAGLRGGTTKATLKGWSATPDATSWFPHRVMTALMI